MVVIRTFRHLCIKNDTNVDSFIIIHASVMSKLTLISEDSSLQLHNLFSNSFYATRILLMVKFTIVCETLRRDGQQQPGDHRQDQLQAVPEGVLGR